MSNNAVIFKLTLQYVPTDDQFETPQSLEGFGRSSKMDYSSCIDVCDLVLYLLSRAVTSSKVELCVVLLLLFVVV
ncbi:MAG: hypothetical protein ACI8RD_007513 [Bacillariaceae sp.]|jgi:hypothetical protein